MKLKTNLKKMMDAKGLRIGDLSRLSGTPKQRLSDWLSGATARNLDQLRSVALTLDTTIDELLFGESSSTKNKTSVRQDSFNEEQVFEVRIKKITKR